MRGGEQRIFILQSLTAQGFAAVGVRRSPLGIVPWRVAAVADFLAGLCQTQHSTSVRTQRFKLNAATLDSRRHSPQPERISVRFCFLFYTTGG